MSQSFVARVRGTVRKSLESSDEVHTAVDNIADTMKPNVRLPKVVVGLRELDPDELAGAGARAIFEPLGNILSAKFVGVNKSFCDMFGFDRSDLPTSTFKIMQGPLTDTKHLQEVRAPRPRPPRPSPPLLPPPPPPQLNRSERISARCLVRGLFHPAICKRTAASATLPATASPMPAMRHFARAG